MTTSSSSPNCDQVDVVGAWVAVVFVVSGLTALVVATVLLLALHAEIVLLAALGFVAWRAQPWTRPIHPLRPTSETP